MQFVSAGYLERRGLHRVHSVQPGHVEQREGGLRCERMPALPPGLVESAVGCPLGGLLPRVSCGHLGSSARPRHLSRLHRLRTRYLQHCDWRHLPRRVRAMPSWHLECREPSKLRSGVSRVPGWPLEYLSGSLDPAPMCQVQRRHVLHSDRFHRRREVCPVPGGLLEPECGCGFEPRVFAVPAGHVQRAAGRLVAGGVRALPRWHLRGEVRHAEERGLRGLSIRDLPACGGTGEPHSLSQVRAGEVQPRPGSGRVPLMPVGELEQRLRCHCLRHLPRRPVDLLRGSAARGGLRALQGRQVLSWWGHGSGDNTGPRRRSRTP